MLALQLVWQGMPDELQGIEAVRHLNGLLLIGALAWLLSNVVQGVADGVIALHPADVADSLRARRVQTQTRVLARIASSGALVAGLAFMLMTFPRARQLGTSLLASAGVAGLVVGIAAHSVFSNLLAGLQIAMAQPIRIDDVLIVEGEWGRVEEITATYVVLKIWDVGRELRPALRAARRADPVHPPRIPGFAAAAARRDAAAGRRRLARGRARESSARAGHAGRGRAGAGLAGALTQNRK